MRSLLLLPLVLGFLPPAFATEPADLGQGLFYLRIHQLADSEKILRTAVTDTDALVLDLRYTTANEESAAALRNAIASRKAGALLFLLVSPATPLGVAQAINQSVPHLLTVGLAGSLPAPKVVVKTDADSDRRAYDALDAGTALAALISGKTEKERFDEATLVHEFKNGNPDAEPPLAPDPTAPSATNTATPPPRLTDRVLQRAMNLYQALVALRRPGG